MNIKFGVTIPEMYDFNWVSKLVEIIISIPRWHHLTVLPGYYAASPTAIGLRTFISQWRWSHSMCLKIKTKPVGNMENTKS